MDDHVNGVTLDENKTFNFDEYEPIYAQDSGYIQLISYTPIFNELKDYEAEVVIQVNMGDFVVKGEEIGFLCNKQEGNLTFKIQNSEEKQGIESFLNKHMVFADVRSSFYDFRYSIQKIEEVALRALSASVNDPVTGIDCIHSLGYFLGRLAEIEEGYFLIEEDGHPAKLYYEGPSFKKDAYRFLRSIIQYGVKDLATVLALFDVYKDVAAMATKRNLETLEEIAHYTKEKAHLCFEHEKDIEMIDHDFMELLKFIERKKGK